MCVLSRKQREFERRGQHILACALTLFEADAWEQVTVEQIAQRAEVGKGTIYKHFSSKNDIYAHLAMQFQHHILSCFTEIDSNLPVVDRFRKYMQAAWQVHLSSRELHRVFLYCNRVEFRTRLSPETLAKLQAIELQVATPTRELLAEGIAQKVFPDKPLELLIFGAQSAFWGSVQLIWSGYLGDIDRKRYFEEISNFILAGLMYQDNPAQTNQT